MPKRIEVITGPMFSGKTEELYRRIKRYVIAKKRVVLFVPEVDTRERYIPAGIEFTTIKYFKDIEKWLYENKAAVDVVAVDETQFLDAGNNTLAWLPDHITVIVSGLNQMYNGDTFFHMANIMAIADSITLLTAICELCGEEAILSKRVDKKDIRVVSIGGKDKYIPVCRKCWWKEI